MKTYYLPKAEDWLDIAFRKARKKSVTKQLKDRVKRAKTKEVKRIEIASGDFLDRIDKAWLAFPDIDSLTPFQREMVSIIIGLDHAKKVMAKIWAAKKIIQRLKKEHIVMIKRTRDEHIVKGIPKKFYGRVASVIKSISKQIEQYNEMEKKLREMPKLKWDAINIILAGIPNTGKSTLLTKLTDAKPRIAAYPFTTQKLNIGYFSFQYSPVQVIDTPGLLESPLEGRNAIERKAISAIRYLEGVVLFLIDSSESCGFDLASQQKLLESIERNFGNKTIIVFISKQDISTKQQIEAAKKISGKKEILVGSDKEADLKEKVVAKLKKHLQQAQTEKLAEIGDSV